MGSNAIVKSGRPVKRRRQFPRAKKNQEWETETTCFGVTQQNNDGEVLMPMEMYEDIEVQFNALSESRYTLHCKNNLLPEDGVML